VAFGAGAISARSSTPRARCPRRAPCPEPRRPRHKMQSAGK
jgi:hypothetical protein